MALAQYSLGDESMQTTLKGLGYPGPALLALREMLPTPFDWELHEINSSLSTWGRAVNNSHVAEFRSHKGVDMDGGDHPALRYKLKFDGLDMILYAGCRAFDNLFSGIVDNMSNNVLDWQELGSLLFQLEGAELHMVQLKRWQYRKLLDYCFNSPRQCQLCFGNNQSDDPAICEDCQNERQPEECQICHQTKGRTIGSKFTCYGSIEDPTCECRAHTVCWLAKFHDAELELERARCEMCQEIVSVDSDSEEEYYDAIEEQDDGYEPAAKRRRLE